MKYRVTEEEFELFKSECLRLQKEWGLIEYSLYFGRLNDSYAFASINVDEEGCVARIKMCRTTKTKEDMGDVRIIAKHEMAHLLIHRLEWLGRVRYVAEDEIDVERERLAVKLEKLLSD